MERFLREIRLTADLRHPHILPVLDSGAEGGMLYCVLPYMEGGTLRERLMQDKQLPIAEAVAITRTIADALDYAHKRGLIHRDIKPENILFTKGEAHLGDFGIARLLDAVTGTPTTTTGVIRGTPAYMSPEQASGERHYDGRSDIYSLGCVFYEMVSGMAPFIGPTSQSVMAQRFANRPRPMSVYRDTVSSQIEEVIARAMMTAPADRYATAAEFSAALEAAAGSTSTSTSTGALTGRATVRTRRPKLGLILTGVVVAAAIVAGAWIWRGRATEASKLAASVRPDTTQLALLPFEREGVAGSESFDALLYDAFARWTGITVVEPFRVRDAVMRGQSPSAPMDSRKVALTLGVGRYVRGTVVPVGDSLLVQAALYGLTEDKPLANLSRRIPRRPEAGAAGYAEIASSLLLRGRPDTALGSRLPATRSLTALQWFTGAFAALDDWDLARADSLFQRAIAVDPDYARAYLWAAQVRAWQNPLTAVVSSALLVHAIEGSARLSLRERELADALQALEKTDYDKACGIYDELRRRNASDFAAWYGLGQCRVQDLRVVRDPRTPTGWRYVASFEQAVQAYQHAFEVLSLSHRSFQRGAYQPLRDLLYLAPTKLHPAHPPAPDTTRLVGRLDRDGDSLVMRPIPLSLVMSGDPRAVPKGLSRAIEHQQQVFQRIASAWSTALPQSAGAKEAVAVSLEMRGDRSALDTLRAAQGLVTDPLQKLRFASGEAILRLKFVDPADANEVAGIRRLSDSLLAAHPHPTPDQADFLSPLAALTGQCATVGALAPQAQKRDRQYDPVPRDILADAFALQARTALGCSRGKSPGVAEIRRRIAAVGSAIKKDIEYSMIAPSVRLSEPLDSVQLATLGVNDYLLRAQLAGLRHAKDSVRAALARVDAARATTGYNGLTADAVYPEARLLLSIGDTTEAIARLDRLLERMRFSTPGALERPINLASLLRAMVLRADVAAARKGPASAAQWGTVVATLWSGADPDLMPTVRRLSSRSPRR